MMKARHIVGLVVASNLAMIVLCSGLAITEGDKPKFEKAEQETIAIYTPTAEFACATDPAFLDSSPLTAPARFVLVKPGMELVKVDMNFVGKGYWGLSAGGNQTIYVYRDQLDSRFTKIGEVKR